MSYFDMKMDKKSSSNHLPKCAVKTKNHDSAMCRDGAGRYVDLGLLPLSVGLCMFAAMFICYTIAVLKGHTDPFLPSISDTGIRSPEQYIFSQLINIASVLAIMTFLLRYKMICVRLSGEENLGPRRYSLVCCIIAITGAVGLTVIANFPDDTMVIVHYSAAGMLFTLGTLYMFLDSIMTFKMNPTHNGRGIAIVRLGLAIVSCIALIITVTGSVVFQSKYDKNNDGVRYDKQDVLHWTFSGNEKGHAVYLTKNIAEWVLAFCFNIYFFTYIWEFQNFTSALNVKMLLCGRAGSDASKVGHDRTQSHSDEHGGSSESHAPVNERTSLLSNRNNTLYV